MGDENTRPADGTGPDARGDDDTSKEARSGQASLQQALRDIGGAGRESLDAAVDAGRSLRGLLLADFALARSALGHALIWIGVALVFGAAACLLTMGAAIALLQALGLSWLASLSITAAACIVVTAFGVWMVLRYLRHTSLEATRRQLRRLGLGDDDDDDGNGVEDHAAQDGGGPQR